jgi:hypothetical protein
MRRPLTLYVAAVICFLLLLGALQSEGRLDNDPATTGDPNTLTPIFSFFAPLLLVAAVIWSVLRATRSRSIAEPHDVRIEESHAPQLSAAAITARPMTNNAARPGQGATKVHKQVRQDWNQGRTWAVVEALSVGIYVAHRERDRDGLLLLAEQAREFSSSATPVSGLKKPFAELHDQALKYVRALSDSQTHPASPDSDDGDRNEYESTSSVVDSNASQRKWVTEPPGAAAREPGHDPALHILRERLARGEIDVEEYRARRDALTEL